MVCLTDIPGPIQIANNNLRSIVYKLLTSRPVGPQPCEAEPSLAANHRFNTAAPKKIRLGDMLMEHGIISAGQLREALGEQKKTGRKLGQIFVEKRYLSETDLPEFIARQLNCPMVDLSSYRFRPEYTKRLSEAQARRFRALVLDENPEDLLAGMTDPADIFSYSIRLRACPTTCWIPVAETITPRTGC